MKKGITISALILLLVCWSSMLIFSMNIRPLPLAHVKRHGNLPFQSQVEARNTIFYPTYYGLLAENGFRYSGNTTITSRSLGNDYIIRTDYLLESGNTTIIRPTTYLIRLIPSYPFQQGPK